MIRVSPDPASVQGGRLAALMAGWPRPPVFQIMLAVYVAVLVAAGVVWAALRMPGAEVRFAPAGSEIRIVTTRGEVLASVDRGTLVTFAGAGRQVNAVAGALVQDGTPDAGRGDVSAWYADRTRLARMLSQGQVRMTFVDEGQA